MRKIATGIARLAPLLVVALLLGGCDRPKNELRLHVREADMPAGARDYLVDALSIPDLRLTLPRESSADVSGLELLLRGDIDLAVVENSATFQPGIETVLPLSLGVLHILVRDGIDDVDERLFLDHSLYFDRQSAVAEDFLQFISERFGVEIADLHTVDDFDLGVTDVIMVFASLLPRDILEALDGYHLYSLGAAGDLGRGSPVESVPYLIPELRPFVIPATTYPELGNEEPVVTVAVDMLLVTRADIPDLAIYRFTKNLMRRRAELASRMPALFHGLTEEFDPQSLTFPLHPGAEAYLARNEPSFLERYAETINLLVYVFVIFVTSIYGAVQWQKRRKKNRVDRYYARVLEISDRLHGDVKVDPEVEIGRLYALEKEAFAELINERLAADESFRIFHSLVMEVREHALALKRGR